MSELSAGPRPSVLPAATKRARGVLSRTTLVTFGMAAQGLARFVYTILIGRLAGAEALADASSLLSLAVWLSLVLPAGLGVAASRFLPVTGLAGAARTQLVMGFWISAGALALASWPMAFWLVGDPWVATSSAFLVFTYSAYVFTRGAAMGEDRILRATIADLVSSLVAITALIGVLVGGLTSALLVPLGIGYGLFAWIVRPRTQRRSPRPEETATVWRFVGDATLSGLATGGLLPLTMIFVRGFDSPLQAGLFAAALSLATPASLLSQAINQVLIPHFSRMHRDVVDMRRAHLRLLGITVTLFAVIFGLLVGFAEPILQVFYGDQFAGGAAAMQVLLAVVFLISATSAPSAYLMAAGRQRAFAVIWIVAFFVGAATMAVASPALGMWGALLGFAVGGGGGSLGVVVAALLLPPRPLPAHHTSQRIAPA